MARWIRILAILGTILLRCVTYLWFFGIQTFFAIEAQNAARKLPFVKLVPTELPDLSISKSPSVKLDYFGYEFEVPWTDIDNEKSKIVGDNKAIIAFRSGNVLSVWSGRPHEFMDFVLGYMKIGKESFREIYGEGALDSTYSFNRLILETTPNKISVFSPERAAAGQGTLLLVKAMSISGDSNSGIFEVENSEMRGFQCGNPKASPKQIGVELFPDAGHLDLSFFQKESGETLISQADINRIVRTIHKLPTGPAPVASITE